LRFATRNDELTVYSVGKDGKDDGGREGSKPGEPDETFTLKLRPRD
jgi:hypothetical protein